MKKILLLKKKIFRDAIIKEKIRSAIHSKNVEKIRRNLKELECLDPTNVVGFIEGLLEDLKLDSKRHNAQLDLLDTIDESIEILKTDCRDKIEQINEMEKTYKSILPVFDGKKDKINKNDEIMYMLRQALDKFKTRKTPYPEVLTKLYRYINDRKINKIEKIKSTISEYSREDMLYIEGEINNSYTMSSLKDEINHLKENSNSKKNDERLKLDLKVLRKVREVIPPQKENTILGKEMEKPYEINI